MTGHTRPTAATVGPMESGPGGAGRPVVVDGWVIGIAESWDDVDKILERAGLPQDVTVDWIGGAETVWE
jgi:hypothetical protein